MITKFELNEKEAAQLRSQLTGINLAFATPVVDEYIDASIYGTKPSCIMRTLTLLNLI